MPQPESQAPAAAILELAVLDVRRDGTRDFESALTEALPLIRRQRGCQHVELRPCLENAQRYILLVWWATLADHQEGFRQSADYRRWRALLHGFYEPFPSVEHYGPPLQPL